MRKKQREREGEPQQTMEGLQEYLTAKISSPALLLEVENNNSGST